MGKRAPFLKDLPKNQAEAQTEFQAGLQPKVRIPDLLKKRKKELEEDEAHAQVADADALSVSDAPQVPAEPPIQLAQTGVEAATVIDAAAAATAGGTATGTAAATTTATGFTAAGTTAAASGAAAASTVAATSAAAATTTTLTTAASIGGATSVAGVAGGAVALGAAAGGGGGGGGGGSDGSPEPLPPANPFPSSDGSNPGLLDLGGGSSGAGPFVSNFSVQDNVAPTNDSLPSWSPTNDKTPTFNFQAPPGQTIKIYNGDKFIGFAQEDPDNPGNYSFTPREDDETGGDEDELNPDLSEGINSITWTVTPPGGTEGPKSDPFVLNVDTTAPRAPLVDAVRMPAGGLPEVSGYARLAPGETLEVVINGATYSVTPNANGFWSLDLATAQPTSGVLGTFTTTPGNYPVVATAIDPAGNRTEDTTTNEVVIYAPSGGPAPVAPTVEPIFSTGSPAPQLSGTLQLTAGVLPAGQTFSVVVNGATYTYSPGKPGFTINPDGTWSLDLQTATPTSGTLGSFTAGTTYPVRAEVTQGANTSFSTAPWVAEAPPPTKPTAPTSYQDNSGASQSSTSNDPVTDDTTPGINIGPGLTPQLTPKLYVNGIPVPATYDPATGTLTPTTPLPPGNYEFTYSVTNDSGNESPPSDPIAINIIPDGPVHRLSVSGTSFPTGILNNSLVVDLGATFGVYQNTLYYTERVGQEVVTRAVSYRDINDVNGTTVNDQISGNSRANILSGGAGDDIIYGDGGADTLRGGAGQDWILFKPLTRGSGASPYNGGVEIQLAGISGSLVGIYKNTTHTNGIFLEASGFEHVVGSDGNDTIVGNNADNILDGAGGDDRINGGAGNDHLFGGSSLSGGIGNQLTGGIGRDTFWVGYEINPVTRSRDASFTGTTELASDPRVFDPILNSVSVREISNSSTIHDWNFAQDRLRVSFSGVAIIGGLEGANFSWDFDNTVDLRNQVVNNGIIKIAAGIGTNDIFLSSGRDQVWTGYAYIVDGEGSVDGAEPPDPTATPSALATDILWGWDSQPEKRDALNVSEYSQAVIALLQGKADWSGNDTVDLRLNVTNSGAIIISTDSGSNTVYGSAGIDHIYGSANGGTNQVWGGLGADIFYVGTRRIASTGVTSTVASRDLIWDWEPTDQLNVASGATAIIAGLMAGAWTISNTVDLTDKATNDGTIIIALGDLDDTFTGSSGIDDIYGGTSTDAGNMIRGGLGSDHFYVGFNYNPNTNTRSELGPTDTAIDVILDWQDADKLTVGTRGQAIIGGLYGFANFTTSGWNLGNNINFSHASNSGLINVAMGAGTNQVTASTGVDHFFVGSYFPGTSSLTIAPSAATDVIYGWDSQGTSADFLTVSTVGTAVIGALLGQTSWSNRTSWSDVNGWSGNDTVDLRRQVNNAGLIQVASGAGSNSIYGSGGSDHFYVGYTNDVNGVAQTLPSPSRATDIIYGWDSRLWNSEPFAGAWSSGTNWNGSTNTSDLTYDRLTVAIGSTARIGSLANQSPTDLTRWDSVNRVDLRSHVSNLNVVEAHGGGIEIWTGAGSDYVFGSTGRDLIYSGPGLDNLWGGDGNDVFYVGYSPSWAPFGADAAEPRIWDWQNKNTTSSDVGSAGSPGDGLRIASGSFVIIQGLWGMDSASTISKEDRWSGNNIVDLRWDVVNNGKIILETGTGNDTIYGSTGIDFINAGADRNTILLDNGGADRVYIDTHKAETQIAGFSSDDLIYLDTRVLDRFKTARGITTLEDYNKTVSADDRVVDLGLISDGQVDKPGTLFPLSPTVFNSVYNGELSGYSEIPRDPNGAPEYGWSSNGAYNNAVYQSIWPLAVTGVSTTAFGFYTTAAGLSLIPIVGPIIAIGPLTIAGLMAADAGQSQPYLNAVYGTGKLDSGASLLSNDKAVSSTVGSLNPSTGVYTGTWDAPNFLQFYNVAESTREYAPSLEFSSHQLAESGTLYGVASYLVLHGVNETFIYLVASRDGLIQNNEAKLIAQIEGQVNASQIKLYDGSTDTEYLRYFNNPVAAPTLPPNPSISPSGVIALTGGKSVLYKVSYTPVSIIKTEGSSSVTESNVVTFSALKAGEKVTLAGLTFTATGDVSAENAAAAFAGLTSGATSKTGINYGTYSGTLTGWNSATTTTVSNTFTSTTLTTNVVDLSRSTNSIYRYVNLTDYNALLAATTAGGVSNLSVYSTLTNDTSVQIKVTFDVSLGSADSVKVYVGSTLIGTYSSASAEYASGTKTLTLNLPPFTAVAPATTPDGAKTVRVVVSNLEFDNQISRIFTIDTTKPDADRISVKHTELGLEVTSNEAGTATLVSGATSITSASLLNPNTGTETTATLTLAAQNSITTAQITVADVFGQAETYAIKKYNNDGTSTSTTATIVLGTSGDDAIGTSSSGSTANFIYGFGGNETIYAGNQSTAIYGGAGNDTIFGGSEDDTITGGTGIDLLSGRGGNDKFVFSAGDSVAVAGSTGVYSSGQDTIQDWTSGDLIVLGGTLSANFDLSTDVLIGTPSGGGSSSVSTATAFSASTYLVDLNGGDSDFELAIKVTTDGTAAAFATSAAAQAATALDIKLDDSGRTVIGGANSDIIVGGAGNDTITGGGGADLLTGGAGNDTFVFNAAVGTSSDSTRIIQAGGGNDNGQDSLTDFKPNEDVIRIVATNVNIFTHGTHTAVGLGVDTATGSDADSFSKLTGLISLNQTSSGFGDSGDIVLTFNSIVKEANFESSLQYQLSGTTAGDQLTGGSRADTLTGGLGADVLSGGAGNDRFVFSAGDSSAVAGSTGVYSSGQDTIQDWTSGDLIVLGGTLSANFDLSTDVLIGTPSGGGSSSVSTATAFSASTYLVDLNGGDSDFELAIKVTTDGTAAAFATSAAAQAATALDIKLDDSGRTVIAGANSDIIVGGSGNDTITGGRGADLLTGGDGNDRFVFAAGDSNVDSFDKISGVGLVQNAGNTDTIDLVGSPTVSSNAGATNGTDFGVIKSHTISNGLVNFDDEDAFSSALTDFTLTDAVGYLQANIAGVANDGKTVVFKLGLNSYLFQNNENSNDLLIEFTNTTIDGLTTDSLVVTPNYLFIA